MPKTINFCGDSFCKDIESPSWPYCLANSLECEIIGRGRNGSAYEHALLSFDNTADYTVFCWTEPHRLYHREYPLNSTSAKAFKTKNKVFAAAHAYFEYAHDYGCSERRQKRELYWFDHEVLSQYKGVVLHCWSFNLAYQFKHGITFETPLISLTQPSHRNINHFTEEENFQLFTQLYKLIRSYDGKN